MGHLLLETVQPRQEGSPKPPPLQEVSRNTPGREEMRHGGDQAQECPSHLGGPCSRQTSQHPCRHPKVGGSSAKEPLARRAGQPPPVPWTLEAKCWRCPRPALSSSHGEVWAMPGSLPEGGEVWAVRGVLRGHLAGDLKEQPARRTAAATLVT